MQQCWRQPVLDGVAQRINSFTTTLWSVWGSEQSNHSVISYSEGQTVCVCVCLRAEKRPTFFHFRRLAFSSWVSPFILRISLYASCQSTHINSIPEQWTCNRRGSGANRICCIRRPTPISVANAINLVTLSNASERPKNKQTNRRVHRFCSQTAKQPNAATTHTQPHWNQFYFWPFFGRPRTLCKHKRTHCRTIAFTELESWLRFAPSTDESSFVSLADRVRLFVRASDDRVQPSSHMNGMVWWIAAYTHTHTGNGDDGDTTNNKLITATTTTTLPTDCTHVYTVGLLGFSMKNQCCRVLFFFFFL